MEAYQTVYAPQELTEEQVWEEVENWVNDLIEEGYDLSDYTWEEMYESYIEEQGAVQGSLFTRSGSPQNFRGNPGGKPRTPFVRTEPVPTKSRVQPTPPKTPASTARQSPGQLSIPKPTSSVTKPNTYRPGATVRATGPNMNKFPQLQRFANQARKVAEPVSRVSGALAGLSRITPAGVAAAVSAPRPTASGTLTSALKRGAYKPQQGPKNPDQGLTKSKSFDKAYKTAKNSSGMGSTFTWNNKSYKVEGYDAPQELTEEVEIATEYFYEMGLNEYGIDILIEELGVEEFVDWVNEIAEDYTLNEARSAKRRRAGGPSYEEVKKKQDERDAAKAREKATKAAVENQPETKETPKQTKKGLFAAIDAGIERHNKATKNVERLAGETGKTIRKAATSAAPFASGVASGISGAARLAGRLLRKEEYDALFSYVLDEGYADNEEAATTIVENMSEKWISTILEAHPVDDERLLMQTGRPYRQRPYLKAKPKKKSIGD
jgi:hypothetical protein